MFNDEGAFGTQPASRFSHLLLSVQQRVVASQAARREKLVSERLRVGAAERFALRAKLIAEEVPMDSVDEQVSALYRRQKAAAEEAVSASDAGVAEVPAPAAPAPDVEAPAAPAPRPARRQCPLLAQLRRCPTTRRCVAGCSAAPTRGAG